MRSIITCTILFLWACACSASEPVQTLTYCDNLSGWSNNVQLSRDAQEGRFAVAASLPAGRTGFFTYDFFSTGQDISQRHSLSFWWKAEGNGLRDLKIKVRNHPLGGGREAIYTIWAGQTPPQGWQLAVVELAKPHAIWGSEPDYNRRYITYRTETSSNSNARLFIDHITTIDQTFSWQVDAPVQEINSIDHLDFDGNGAVGFSDFILFVQKFGATQADAGYDPLCDLDSDGQIGFGDFLTFAAGFESGGTQWYIPITLENTTTQPLNIVVGNVQDRQGSGTGHGWAGAQKVLWNCEAESFIVQKPPTSQNYAIGCIGEKREGWYRREDGYWESHGRKVSPRSLYLKQLEDRLGIEAVKAVATSAQIGRGN